MSSISRKVLTALAVSAVTASVASAQAINFQGFTNGCFNCASPNPTANPAPQSAVLGPLSFMSADFNVTTAGGFAGIGATPTPTAAPSVGDPTGGNFNNLGSLSLASGSNFTFTGNTFALRVTFTVPAGVTGGNEGPNSNIFAATLTGQVISDGTGNTGGALIVFTNNSQTFAFGSGATAGTFTFSVNNTSLNQGDIVPLTGQIVAASTVPEPSTYALMGTGLLGLLGVARRKKNNA